MSIYELGISSADAIQLYPEYDYAPDLRKIETVMRTPSGRMWAYKWGDYHRWKFTVNYVPVADAAVVNSWYDTNTELLFFVTSGSATEVNSVMLRGKSRPLIGYNKPYNDQMRGKIQLETY